MIAFSGDWSMIFTWRAHSSINRVQALIPGLKSSLFEWRENSKRMENQSWYLAIKTVGPKRDACSAKNSNATVKKRHNNFEAIR